MDKRIGFGHRFLALLIDIVLVSVIGILVAPLVGAWFGGAVAPAAPAAPGAMGGWMATMMANAAAMGFVAALYFLLEAFTGYTLGKLILGLRIGTEHGHAAAVPTLFTRYAIKNIGWLMALIAGVTGVALINTVGSVLGLVVFIGMFLVLGQARQALHDKIAKTAVFRKADLGAAPAPVR